MGYDLTISGLRRKRHELLQSIERRRDEIAHLQGDVWALERALAVFGVVDISSPPQPLNIMFGRSELRRMVVEELREHGERTARQIVLAVIEKKGLEARDYGRVSKSVGKTLRILEERGVASRDRTGRCAMWGAQPW